MVGICIAVLTPSRLRSRNPMMTRRTFLGRSLLGAAGLAVIPGVMAERRPTLWISDGDPSVALSIQVLARHCGVVDAHIFECKRKAIRCLRAEVDKPTFLVTDYASGQMRGNEFIRLARDASPDTKLILFSAVVGNIQRWIAVAGLDAPSPDAIVEKPDVRKLMAALCQTP
jgi:response regulator RpfG family c-di-GMP phosphodiesterase